METSHIYRVCFGHFFVLVGFFLLFWFCPFFFPSLLSFYTLSLAMTASQQASENTKEISHCYPDAAPHTLAR